jgi:hypothetical protein
MKQNYHAIQFLHSGAILRPLVQIPLIFSICRQPFSFHSWYQRFLIVKPKEFIFVDFSCLHFVHVGESLEIDPNIEGPSIAPAWAADSEASVFTRRPPAFGLVDSA